jgi:hypothetical protein
MNLNHFYHYYKSKSGGVSNLLKATEDFDSSIDWNKLPSTDAPTVSGGITDPNGGSDAQRINFTDNRQARVQQQVSLSASTQYTFSVYARVNTGTEQFRLRNVTLAEAEAKTATTSWTRFEYTFTTTTGGNYDLSIQNTDNVAKTVEFWGAMLNVGVSANDYVKVDPSISGSTPTPAYSGFGDVFGDVTAYYSLRKFTEAETLNAIRVRRSSDDTEQDIGFDANGDLDTTALLAFVGTDVDIYTSDFRSAEDLGESNGTGSAPESVADVDDAYKFTLSGGSGSHYTSKSGLFDLSNTYTLSLDYYIPSGQTVEAIQIRTGGSADGVYNEEVTDAWTSVIIEDWAPTVSNTLRIYALAGGSYTIDADGDVFYLKNIVVTQTTADGAVTTWYDQSGNANDVVEATASAQPKIVSAGVTITDGGKPSITVDQTTTNGLTIPIAASSTQDFFQVHKSNDDRFILLKDSTSGARYAYAAIDGNTSTDLHGSYGSPSLYVNGSAESPANRDALHTLLCTDTQVLMSSLGGDSSAWTGNIIWGKYSSANIYDGNVQEIIFFNSDQSGNRTGIETNINDHFDIYT